MGKEKTSFTIRDMPTELHLLLKHEALDRRCTLNELIIEILDEHCNVLGKEEKER